MEDFLLFVLVGFLAQMVDGAIGMAYGAMASSILLGMGVPPAVTSASVHAAETFTTAASGASHWRLGNFDRSLVWRLALPGMLGGAIGVLGLVSIDGDTIKPFIAIYLLLLGVLILFKALRGHLHHGEPPKRVSLLGLFGGFVDSVGGGGWGPIVASSLLQRNTPPREVIGSVNIAEFFVTATISGAFLFTIGLTMWTTIAGLVTGGIVAAPLAAYATRYIAEKSERLLMGIVGVVICALAMRSMLQVIG